MTFFRLKRRHDDSVANVKRSKPVPFPLESLPNDIIAEIFKWITVFDGVEEMQLFFSLRLVSKSFYKFVHETFKRKDLVLLLKDHYEGDTDPNQGDIQLFELFDESKIKSLKNELSNLETEKYPYCDSDGEDDLEFDEEYREKRIKQVSDSLMFYDGRCKVKFQIPIDTLRIVLPPSFKKLDFGNFCYHYIQNDMTKEEFDETDFKYYVNPVKLDLEWMFPKLKFIHCDYPIIAKLCFGKFTFDYDIEHGYFPFFPRNTDRSKFSEILLWYYRDKFWQPKIFGKYNISSEKEMLARSSI